MASNECIPFYSPGRRITAQASAGVTGKRCVMISGSRVSGPALNAATDGGNYQVAHATAAGKIFGVAAYDAASGEKVGVIRGSGNIVPITAAGNIAAFAEVEVGANGQVVTKTSGVAIGYAVTAATSGNDAEIALY